MIKLILSILLSVFIVSVNGQNTYSLSRVHNVSVNDSLILKGTVSSHHYPASDVAISIGKQTVYTDSLGNFELVTTMMDPKIKIKSDRFHNVLIKGHEFDKGDQYKLSILVEPRLPIDKLEKRRSRTYTYPIYTELTTRPNPLIRKAVPPPIRIKLQSDSVVFFTVYNGTEWRIVDYNNRSLSAYLNSFILVQGIFTKKETEFEENLFILRRIQDYSEFYHLEYSQKPRGCGTVSL